LHWTKRIIAQGAQARFAVGLRLAVCRAMRSRVMVPLTASEEIVDEGLANFLKRRLAAGG